MKALTLASLVLAISFPVLAETPYPTPTRDGRERIQAPAPAPPASRQGRQV